MDRLTEQLATFATTLNFDRLGDEVAQSVTQHLVDTLACAFAAHDCEAADIGRRLAGGQTAGLYAGRTLCVDATMPLEMASFVNSGMIRKYDFNDRFPGGHPSDGLGAHLALAGAAPFSGKQFLVAMMVTYEI
jgi:2-methylcitrate dehydratase